MTEGVSVIVPTLNERDHLPGLLDDLEREGFFEVVVVDGGSTDGTLELARRRGARTIRSLPCRGRQLADGADAATGRVLFFVHADCRLPDHTQDQIRRVMARSDVSLGAFRLSIDSRGARLHLALQLRLIGHAATLRARLASAPYGDQGLFIRREILAELGGFRPLPRCEDLDLVLRARRRGRVCIAPSSVVASRRRWSSQGAWTTTLRNWKDALSFMLDSPGRRETRIQTGDPTTPI